MIDRQGGPGPGSLNTSNPPHAVAVPALAQGTRPVRPRPTRFWLTCLVLACIVPAWMLAVGVSYLSYQSQRAALIASAQTAAHNLMRATEREMSSSFALLETLASAPAIDAGDFKGLHDQMLEVQRVASAFAVFMVGSDLQVLALSSRPFGEPLTRLPRDRFPALWGSAKPEVSNLFMGDVDKQFFASAAVPVVRKGQVRARLQIVFSPERFARLIDESQLPTGWVASIVDRDAVFVARSRATQGWTGKAADPALLQDLASRPRGCDPVRTAEGVQVTGCYSRSPAFGWVALVAVPDTLLESSLHKALLEYTAGAALLLLGALLLANQVGRSITVPMRQLVEPALAIGRGESARVEATGLVEANEVATALQQTQTLLRQREQARQQAEARLQDSESRLRLALDAGQVGDWELDLASGRMQHSPQHDQCFGYPQALADWNLARMLAHVHPDDRGLVAQRLGSRTPGGTYLLEFRVLWPDTSLHWIALQGTVLVEQGVANRAVGVIIDITERKQGEEMRLHGMRLEAENQQNLAASRLKSEFLANMSHELRTPLNAVIGFADILRGEGAPQDQQTQQQFLGHIANSGRHLLRLINEVLDLSKVEAGKMEFHPAPVPLPALVQEVVALMQADAARKHIGLATELSPDLTMVELDPVRLKQVLYNFLSNAVKFTPAGGRVVLRTQADGAEHWRLEVEDNGIGIAPADQAKLFTPFQQINTGTDKAHPGTGLGLSLTRRLVELQGGSVGLRSTPGEGSVFHARLPRRMPAAAGAMHGPAT